MYKFTREYSDYLPTVTRRCLVIFKCIRKFMLFKVFMYRSYICIPYDRCRDVDIILNLRDILYVLSLQIYIHICVCLSPSADVKPHLCMKVNTILSFWVIEFIICNVPSISNLVLLPVYYTLPSNTVNSTRNYLS